MPIDFTCVHGEVMCGYDSTVKWEHCDAMWLASGVDTEFRRSVEPVFRNPSYLQHPLHVIANPSKISLGLCWPWKFNTKFERLSVMFDLTLLFVLPVCWACSKQYLSKPTLRFPSKECSMHGLQNAADLSLTSQGLQSVGQYRWRYWF